MAKTTEIESYLQRMRDAQTADELETAIQSYKDHPYRGRVWDRICKVRIEAGQRIVAADPLGNYVPQFGERRMLTICGETYKVGRGQNSTGVRYVWHAAREWARGVLMAHGFTKRAAWRVTEGDWSSYPHRSLKTVAAALAGEIPDPVVNVLISHKLYGYEEPVRMTAERNAADPFPSATRPCDCGGTLFDWGAGFSEGFDYISWYCNACPQRFTEYLLPGQLYEIRNSVRHPSRDEVPHVG